MSLISVYRGNVSTYDCKVLVQYIEYILDIAFKLNAHIFQYAQIFDNRLSTTISTSFKCWVFQDLLSTQLLSKHVIKTKEL